MHFCYSGTLNKGSIVWAVSAVVCHCISWHGSVSHPNPVWVTGRAQSALHHQMYTKNLCSVTWWPCTHRHRGTGWLTSLYVCWEGRIVNCWLALGSREACRRVYVPSCVLPPPSCSLKDLEIQSRCSTQSREEWWWCNSPGPSDMQLQPRSTSALVQACWKSGSILTYANFASVEVHCKAVTLPIQRCYTCYKICFLCLQLLQVCFHNGFDILLASD